ncbi:MAG: STAS domain-containing protein [Gammaproteobacteria bacterium]
MNMQHTGTADWVMELDPELRIGQVQALSEKLRSVLEARHGISLDASRIEIIDTCGLQLLAAFVRDAGDLGMALRWDGASEPFRKAAKLLDLEQHLKLAEISDQPICLHSGVLSELQQEQPRVAQQDRREQTQDRETVRLLDLGIAQIEAALAESDDGIVALSGSFAAIVGDLKAMEQVVREIPSYQAPAELVDTVESYRQAIAKNVNAAVVGMQSYDQLVQRLSHVRDGLACLAELVADESRARVPAAWSDLKQTLRAMYSMSQERNLFDAVMKGGIPEEATNGAATPMATQCEVEWFQRP